MTPAQIADKAAEAVMQTIERDKRIIKAAIAEAIEKVLLTNQMTGGSAMFLDRPAVERSAVETDPFVLAMRVIKDPTATPEHRFAPLRELMFPFKV